MTRVACQAQLLALTLLSSLVAGHSGNTAAEASVAPIQAKADCRTSFDDTCTTPWTAPTCDPPVIAPAALRPGDSFTATATCRAGTSGPGPVQLGYPPLTIHPPTRYDWDIVDQNNVPIPGIIASGPLNTGTTQTSPAGGALGLPPPATFRLPATLVGVSQLRVRVKPWSYQPLYLVATLTGYHWAGVRSHYSAAVPVTSPTPPPPTPPVCTLSADRTNIMGGDNATLTANCTQVPTSYLWRNVNNGPNCSGNVCTVVFSTPGSYCYAVRGTNAAGTGNESNLVCINVGWPPPKGYARWDPETTMSTSSLRWAFDYASTVEILGSRDAPTTARCYLRSGGQVGSWTYTDAFNLSLPTSGYQEGWPDSLGYVSGCWVRATGPTGLQTTVFAPVSYSGPVASGSNRAFWRQPEIDIGQESGFSWDLGAAPGGALVAEPTCPYQAQSSVGSSGALANIKFTSPGNYTCTIRPTSGPSVSATLTVKPCGPGQIWTGDRCDGLTCSASWSPAAIERGETATLTWSSRNDADGFLETACSGAWGSCGTGTLPANPTPPTPPLPTNRFTHLGTSALLLTVRSGTNSYTCSAEVTVTDCRTGTVWDDGEKRCKPVNPPSCNVSFSAGRTPVGSPVKLAWQALFDDDNVLETTKQGAWSGTGTLPGPQGEQTLSFTAEGVYQISLLARNSIGATNGCNAEIEVWDCPAGTHRDPVDGSCKPDTWGAVCSPSLYTQAGLTGPFSFINRQNLDCEGYGVPGFGQLDFNCVVLGPGRLENWRGIYLGACEFKDRYFNSACFSDYRQECRALNPVTFRLENGWRTAKCGGGTQPVVDGWDYFNWPGGAQTWVDAGCPSTLP